jgi:hypothetical protein
MPRTKALPDLDLKGFAAGLAGGGLILLAGGLTLGMNTAGTLERLQSLLASKMLVIEKPGFPKETVETHAVEPPAAEPPQEPEAHAAEEAAPESTATPADFPLKGLTEKTPQGLLPIVRAGDGLTPFKAYARAYKHPATLPRVAVVIGSYGLREDYSALALKLPADMTLLISPYSSQAKNWQQKAREAGHELWLELPMEAENFGDTDPGPKALSSTQLMPENETRLNAVLAQAAGYAGVAGFYTDRFKPVGLMMQSLFEKLFKRGLGYLELNPAPPSTIAETAQTAGAPYAQGVINLADPRFAKNLKDAFDITEGLALDKKPAILIAPPYPKVLEALDAWQKTLAAKGIVLAPLSAVTRKDAP